MALTKIRGVALAPGLSRNNRFYSREAIGRAVARAQGRIRAGDMHMKTHHLAEDDTTRIVGQVTSMRLAEDGSALFEAELADSSHGRDIAALVTGPKPFVRGVSIRGAWAAPVRAVQVGGQLAETADDLDIFGIDFAGSPGVPAAVLAAESAAAGGRVLIFEEAPMPVPVPEGPTVREFAAMDSETFASYAELHFGRQQAAIEAARPRSPFWRGTDFDSEGGH